MKAWYSKVRDAELKDGSVRATYVVTFETDNAELKREVEKYLQGIMDKDEPQNYCDDCLYTDTCDDKAFFYACTSKATISKMEQVDKDINVRSKDEPQTDELREAKILLKASRDLLNKQNETIYVLNLLEETVEYHGVECDGYCLIDDIDDWLALQTEPQTCSVNGRPYDCGNCEYFRCTADEPQTERSSE